MNQKNQIHKHSILLYGAILLLLLWGGDMFAQGCVQCRMAPESNLDGGGQTARTLNSAILYLMAIPYVLILSIALYVFRKPLLQRYRLWKLRRTTGASH